MLFSFPEGGFDIVTSPFSLRDIEGIRTELIINDQLKDGKFLPLIHIHNYSWISMLTGQDVDPTAGLPSRADLKTVNVEYRDFVAQFPSNPEPLASLRFIGSGGPLVVDLRLSVSSKYTEITGLQIV